MGASFDLIVLGAGSGGYACAFRAAQLGFTVALVEKDKVGGTCLHRGCIPTKAMLHAAEVADSVRNGSQFGVHAAIDKIDLAGVVSYADGVVGRIHKGLSGLVGAHGITVIPGAGRLTQDHRRPTVTVGDQTYQATHLVLATGSYPRSLPELQIDGTRILTSEQALRLDRLPASAIVLGGGVIGVEFASAWRSFGVSVTIVEALPRLVSGEDSSISAALERAFRRRKINVVAGATMARCRTTESGVRMELADGQLLEAELMLVAVGRGPQTSDLGYEEAGVELDDGFVRVNERLQTSVPSVYAVGDLHGRADLLAEMHRLIAADAASLTPGTGKVVVYLGDYVDRGLESRRVIDLLIKSPLEEFQAVHLLGNHDAWLLSFLVDPAIGPVWLRYGGDATMHSYGVQFGIA